MIKRISAKVLMAVLCISLMSPAGAYAAETEGANESAVEQPAEAPAEEPAPQPETPPPSPQPSAESGNAGQDSGQGSGQTQDQSQDPAPPASEDEGGGTVPKDPSSEGGETPSTDEDPSGQEEFTPEPLVGPDAEKKEESPAEEEKKPEEKKEEEKKEETEASTVLPPGGFVQSDRTFTIPKAIMDFRFYRDSDAKALYAKKNCSVYESKKKDAKAVGKLFAGTKVYVLAKESDGWYYVESGDVRGFIKKGRLTDSGSGKGKEAERLVANKDNTALTYKKSTARKPVTDDRAVAKKTVDVLDDKGSGNTVGILHEDDLAYILLREDGYAFIESGNVRGFVDLSNLTRRKNAEKLIAEKGGTGAMSLAETTVDPESNGALYYTILSCKEGIKPSDLRAQIVAAAEKALGHAYIWGGTDPFGKGADCSGFVQTLFRMYGFNLPRVACDQAFYGTKIDIKDAQPGDLIFFAQGNGYIHHVALCSSNNNGDPLTIEALGRAYGITRYHALGRDGCWATRLIND